MTQLAVIIINHQHGDMLRKTIESLMTSPIESDHKVIVVNNLPEEATTTWIGSNYPQVELIENETPKGFASNINMAIRQHPGFDYYLLLNPDVTCKPGMVDALVSAMEHQPKVGAAGPQLLDPDGTVQPSRRRFASFFVLVMRALHIDSLLPNLHAVERYLMKDVNFTGMTDVDWVTGAVMILRKTALDQVGLMDERFFLYFEDEDLCCRLWQNGWRVCYLPTAQAYHIHLAEGRKKIFSKANFHHISSAFKMLQKYHGKITRCYDREYQVQHKE